MLSQDMVSRKKPPRKSAGLLLKIAIEEIQPMLYYLFRSANQPAEGIVLWVKKRIK